jgi:hypothetical protein
MENGAVVLSPPAISAPVISSLLEHAAAKAAASTSIGYDMFLFIFIIV